MIVLLSAVFLVFALIEWGVGEMLLLPRFEQIERDNAATAMKRIDAGVTPGFSRAGSMRCMFVV